jgi:serine/arginine repetitive matrix protein 2
MILYYRLRETHEIAQAQQQKNAKLREAFGISDYFVEGTSFDPERKHEKNLQKAKQFRRNFKLTRMLTK